MIPTAALGVPLYELDTFGLTLWTDGFGGSEPAVRARVAYHWLVARPGRSARLAPHFPVGLAHLAVQKPQHRVGQGIGQHREAHGLEERP